MIQTVKAPSAPPLLKCPPPPLSCLLPDDSSGYMDRFVAGAMAGSLAQLTIYPLEIAKTRLAVGEKGEFRGIGDCIARIVR